MKSSLIVVIVLALVGMAACGKAVSVRNQLTTEHEAIRGQFANVDAVLQRRADLIPNLVATVKGYASHEKEIFEKIAEARSALLNARDPQSKIQANSQLDSALGRLLALQENYPDLKASEQFRNLQFELAGAENRINIERQKYNDLVRAYNTDLQLFPNNLVAGVFGLHAEDQYFKADAAAQKAPEVKF